MSKASELAAFLRAADASTKMMTGNGTVYSQSADLIEAQEKTIEELREALAKVVEWKMPETGEFWDDEKTRPMSYGAAYGSNGERDYIRSLASQALASIDKGEGG